MIHILGLTIELQRANIQISGCNSSGIVWASDGSEIQDRPDVAAIISIHNATAWYERDQRILDRQSAAEPYARTISNGWRTWTQDEWTNYYNANISDTEIDKITSLPEAKIFLKRVSRIIDRMAKMEIALRDNIFPSLPEDQ